MFRKCVWLISIVAMFYRNSCIQSKQCRPVRPGHLRRMIKVYTVCQCLFYGTLGTNVFVLFIIIIINIIITIIIIIIILHNLAETFLLLS